MSDPVTPTACICDGGAYEVKDHPFLVHPDCPVHRPDTPTADAPADTDLREQVKRLILNEVPTLLQSRAYRIADALLPLVRAQMAKAWNEGQIDGIAERSGYNPYED